MERRFGSLLGVLVLVISALTMAGCPKTAVSSQGQTGYAVSFGIEGEPANGVLTAKIGEKELKNKESAPLGATVVFTARPNDGCKVKEWKVDGKIVNGTENTYSLKISKAVSVTVSFEKTSPPPSPTAKRKVTFSVEGTPANGTLKAMVGSTEIGSGAAVEQGKTVLFTASPAAGFMVESWTGITPASPNAAEVTHTVTADITVKVTFKKIPSQTFSVTVQAGEHGKALVNPSLLEGNKAAKGTVLIFTATPDDGFVVDKWTIQGGSFEAGTGEDGNSTAKVKVTADVAVRVSFKAKPAGTVQYNVEHWQQNVTGNDYIKVDTEDKTGVTGAITEAQAKTYTGFRSLGIIQKPIAADGSTVVQIKYDRNLITLTLNLDGGGLTPPLPENKLKGRFGSDVPAVANPIKEGYVFSVWNPELPKKFPAENGTYTAQWAKEGDYTITYHLDGDSYNTNPASYNVETATITLNPAIKIGYDFAGWYDNAACSGYPVTHIVKGSTGNKEFWPKWKVRSYTITYNLDGGTNNSSNPDSYTVETETIILKPAIKIGYDFLGWYDNASCSGYPVTHIEKGSTRNKEFWAKWEAIPYTITYHLNGGKNDADNSANYTIETKTILLKDAEKEGYTFKGWYNNAACSGSPVTCIEKGSTGDREFWAKWEAVTYSITYHLNGGENDTGNPANYMEIETITLKPAVKTGYDFLGWYDNASYSGSPVTCIEKDSTGNKAFWAKWKIVTYSISYNLDGGKNHVDNPANYTVETATILLKDAEKKGYTFKGWYDNAACSGYPVTHIEKGSTGNKAFWAKWEIAIYSISYNLNGGKNHADNPANYTVETETIWLKDAEKKGYTFEEWCEPFPGGYILWNQIKKGSTGNKTFQANWKIVTYGITYHLNGGENDTDNPVNYTIETATIWLKPAEKKGYTFKGWYNNAACSGSPVTDIVRGSTGYKEFWAKWEAVTYSITYHLNGGSHSGNPASYNAEMGTITLEDANKANYTFKGWYNNAACSGSPVTDIVRGSTGYKEFWAKWEAVTYSLTYHLNGGSHSGNPASYNAEMGTITLEDANKANYTFKGWYDNAEFTGSPVTRIVKGSTGNKELWAKWEAISYTITYDLDGGKNHTDNPANYTIETETITLKPAVKKEYIFKGWYDNAEFTGSPVTCIEKGSTGNKTFWAKWKINEYMVTFSVEGEHGTLTAQSDGIAATADSPITVEHGKTVTFTAEPAGDYKVNKWTVTPAEALQTGGGGGKSITVKVSAATEVKVTFNPSFDKTYTIGDVSFTMKGIDAVTYERLGHSDESNNQPHTVSISAYRIGETEVTQELWQAVMGNNPSNFQGTRYPPESGEVQEKRPVEEVSWYECIAFCNELTKKAGFEAADCVYYVQGSSTVVYTKAHAQVKKQPIQRLSRKGFRLPTEAEWEWAAKGGTEDKWAGTNDEDTLGNYAWCYKNSNQKTHQVKLKLPNGYGLYDMSGNVQEWCWDRAGELPDPLPADYEGYYDGYQRVFRGGGWCNGAFQAARAYRKDYNSGRSYDDLGLRVACRP